MAGPRAAQRAARPRRCHGGAAVLLSLLLAALLAAGAAAQGDARPVSTPDELLEALEDPSVATISVMRPMTLPHDFGPVVVRRQLLVTSPVRAIVDWCDAACDAGKAARPFIVLDAGAMVTFNRLFFRSFIPASSAAYSDDRPPAATPPPGVAGGGNLTLDFVNSPVPFVVGRGGQATYNLVVLHWTPEMLWVYGRPRSYWAQAAVGDILSTRDRAPLRLDEPGLYNVKNFAVDGSGTIADCYMPVDVRRCLAGDAPFDTALIYCPYTFKDSLKNSAAQRVLVFHPIGLDRLVNSYRNPAVVNRTVTYMSCPGTRQLMDLDNITSSVLVAAGGSLTFENMVLQGSKSQNRTDWPSNVPLLLSTFKPVDGGTITLRDTTVRVHDVNDLIRALDALPSGSTTAVETPNLQPTYAPGAEARLGEPKFTIKRWQLQQQRWLTSMVGGSALLDRLGSGTMASWQYFNVTVGGYQPADCFGAAFTQGSVVPGGYPLVSTGQQLLDQLGNKSARYIGLVSDVVVPAGLPRGAVSVDRIVEVRACNPGGMYAVDWSGNDDAVVISGTAIFEGDMVMKGISWQPRATSGGDGHLVGALHPKGTGSVEYEDLTLQAEMVPELWGGDQGNAGAAAMLGVPSLADRPLNMSRLDATHLLLRGYFTNRSEATGGTDGLESFLDVTLAWAEGQGPAGGGGGDAAARRTKIAAIAATIGAVVAVASLVVALLVLRRLRRIAGAANGGTDGKGGGGGNLLPVYALGPSGADKPGGGGGKLLREDSGPPSSQLAVGVMAGSAAATGSYSPGHSHSDRPHGAERTSTCSADGGKPKIGPGLEIAQACKTLALQRSAKDPEELVLQSVLGEGSYGKVFKALWRGTTVAVKVMVLPSHMSGKEKREKMAVMETAISSSLSHPNVVQTYTYAVEPVRSNTTLADHPAGSGPGAGMSLHDSTWSCAVPHGKKCGGDGADGAAADGDSERSATSAISWEVRLVQEFCDLGSLRDALKAGRFRAGDGGLRLHMLVDTALDVSRAMAHLHTHNIIHADLKARNVLLRSDAHDDRGFAAKVADFGLSLTIDPHATHISNAFQGTMTHMAPEVLMHGKLSRSSDVYAFGILLWELYTGEQAYKGVPRALLGHSISKQGLRPEFPADTPFEWQFLACRCWETDPAIRPSFEQILQELKRLKFRLGGGAGGASDASGSPPGSFLSHLNSLPRLGSGPIAAGPSRTVSNLASIEDSETLPTEVDRALWEQQHQQTLEQQELQRRQQQQQQQCSADLHQLTATGAAAAPAGSAARQARSAPLGSTAAARRDQWPAQPPARRSHEATDDTTLLPGSSALVLLSEDSTMPLQ